MSKAENIREDCSVRDYGILAVLVKHELVTRTSDEFVERQPDNVKDAIDEILQMVKRQVQDELERAAEQHRFQDFFGAQTLTSVEIIREVQAHMGQTGKGFSAKHSNAHLVAAMSDALDWIGEGTAREIPTIQELVRMTRKLGTRQQGS